MEIIISLMMSGIFWTMLGVGAGYLIVDSKRPTRKKTIGYACDE